MVQRMGRESRSGSARPVLRLEAAREQPASRPGPQGRQRGERVRQAQRPRPRMQVQAAPRASLAAARAARRAVDEQPWRLLPSQPYPLRLWPRRRLPLQRTRQAGAYFFRGGQFDRTRVSFFPGDAGLWQIVDNRLGLHFEVAGQFVDTNLICVRHSPVDFSSLPHSRLRKLRTLRGFGLSDIDWCASGNSRRFALRHHLRMWSSEVGSLCTTAPLRLPHRRLAAVRGLRLPPQRAEFSPPFFLPMPEWLSPFGGHIR